MHPIPKKLREAAQKSLSGMHTPIELEMKWIWEFSLKESEPEKTFIQILKERAKGYPLAYLIKERGFFKETFYIEAGVLIPRPETEHLVEEGILWGKAQQNKPVFLDMGCGSGCVGISISKELDTEVICIDKNPKAIQVTQTNIERLNAKKVSTLCKDGKDLKASELPFQIDAIITNPPYIKKTDPIEPMVKRHEPHDALYGGGEDGLDIFKSWLPHLLELRAKAIFIETSPYQYTQLINLIKPYYKDISIIKDYAGNERILKGLNLGSY